MDDHLRLSDNDRINALQALAGHYAQGRLEHEEFEERTGVVTSARTHGDLRPLFMDLPGGMEEALTPTRTSRVVDQVNEDARELKLVKKTGKRFEKINAAIFGVTLISFFLLMFVFSISWAWIVWPVMGITMGATRALSGFTDADEKAYQELKKAEEEERSRRLRQATARLRELEQ